VGDVSFRGMEKRLVINADDFGLCEGVNKGILQAYADGVLTSTSLMVNMPASEQAAGLARKTAGLGIGVHLNLTEGRPVSDAACIGALVDSSGGFAYSPGRLALRSLFSSDIRVAIEAELTEQVKWVIRRRIKPTHLDSHKHVHCFPAIFSIVCRIARRFQIGAVRYGYEPGYVSKPPFPITDADGRKRARTVRMMAKVNRWQNADFFKTDAFFGAAHTGRIGVNFLKAVALYNTARTAELMTHPGLAYDIDAGQTRLVKQRQAELDALCSEQAKKYFENAGVKLVHYGQL